MVLTLRSQTVTKMYGRNGRHLQQEDVAVLREVKAVLDAEGEKQTIQVRCPGCSCVAEYLPQAMRLVSLETTTFQLCWLYKFFCVRCHDLHQVVTDAETWARLREAGLPVEVICGVDECGEIWVLRAEDPLGENDVLGWMAELDELEGLPSELDDTAREIADANGRSQGPS